MNILIQHRLKCIAAMLLTVAMTVCTSCSDENGIVPEPGGASDTLTFSFQLVSTDISTRALDQSGHDETGSEWPEFEDKIVEDDLAFFIFTKNSSGGWPMIMSMTQPLSKVNNANMSVNGMSGVWIINASIAKKQLEDALGYKIEAGKGQQIPIRVAILANAGGGATAATSRVDYASLVKPDFQTFIEEGNTKLFTLTSIHSGNSGDSSVDGIYKGAIPMYGMNEFSVSGDNLYYSSKQNPAWMGNVDLLRALAKVRVVDNIENKDPETGLPKITEAEIYSGTPARAYILPYDAASFKGEQTDLPRIYTTADAAGGSLKMGYYKNDLNVHIGYLPEQYITTGTPYYHLTVALDKDENGNYITKDYDVPMWGYNDQKFEFGNSILRNHIYTLSVNGVATDTQLSMDIEVTQWNESPFDLDYTQSLIVPEDYKFRFSNQEGEVNLTNGSVYFKPWTTSADGTMSWTPITCRFGIQSPIGATWTAYLNTIEGEQDAFAFLDSEGNLQPHLTGIVDNQYVTFRVVTQNREPEVMNRAKLQVYVRFADNTMMEVDLTPENTPQFKNYTLVQNPL